MKVLCKCARGLLFLFMFKRLTEKFASKATDSAVEGVKKSFNDRIDQYGDIIQIGLVLTVIILGGKHITNTARRRHAAACQQMPYGYFSDGGGSQPIVINNYYNERWENERYGHRKNREYVDCGYNAAYQPYGRQGTQTQPQNFVRQNRR